MIKNIEEWSDQDIEDEISRIQSVIKDWAISKNLWFDCGFKSYLEHVNGEPSSPPVVTMLWSEGDFRRFVFDGIDGLDTEFFDLLESHGYFFENTDGVTAEIYPNGEVLSQKFEE